MKSGRQRGFMEEHGELNAISLSVFFSGEDRKAKCRKKEESMIQLNITDFTKYFS